jgi:hypothetical protein
MKRLAFALMLSASAAAGLAETALAATGGQAPPASTAQPSQPMAAALSNPMSGAGTTAGGMMAFQGERRGMAHPMMAMMRTMTTMRADPNMPGCRTGSPIMGGSSAGAKGLHPGSH